MGDIVHLPVDGGRPPVPNCGWCAHRIDHPHGAMYWRCGAHGGRHTDAVNGDASCKLFEREPNGIERAGETAPPSSTLPRTDRLAIAMLTITAIAISAISLFRVVAGG